MRSEKLTRRKLQEQKARVEKSKQKNTGVNNRAIKRAVQENDITITDEQRDPNFLSYLSDCIRQLITETAEYAPFSARIAQFERNKHLYEPNLAEAMSIYSEKLAAAYNKIDQGDTSSSMAGMKGLISVNTEGELFAYCMLLDITKEEVNLLSKKGANGTLSFTNQPLIMSCGIWYRTMFEVAKRYGLTELSEETTEIMYLMHTKFVEENSSESFRFGLNFARRIFSPKKRQRKRGRRPKEYEAELAENVSLCSLSITSAGDSDL